MIRQRLARFIVRRAGYRMVGEVPDTGILVGAPHTSNWDFVTMLLVMWHDGAHPRVLVKKQLFRGPLGWVLRRLGGVPLDRDNASGVVGELVQEARNGEPFRLIIAAEGTRTGVTTGSPVSYGSPATRGCRSLWRSSTRPPRRWDSGRRSTRPTTSRPTWT